MSTPAKIEVFKVPGQLHRPYEAAVNRKTLCTDAGKVRKFATATAARLAAQRSVIGVK